MRNMFEGAGRFPEPITRASDAYPFGPDPQELRALRLLDRHIREGADDIETYGDLSAAELAQVRDAELGDWADLYEE